MGMKSEIEAALLVHAAWLKHFRDYLNGRGSFDVMRAGASDQCDFGKWLDHEGHHLMSPALQGEMRTAHDEFHQIASEIIEKIRMKRFAEAHADISSHGALNRVSTRLSSVLLKASLHEGGATGASLPPNEAAPNSPESEQPPDPSLTAPPQANTPE